MTVGIWTLTPSATSGPREPRRTVTEDLQRLVWRMPMNSRSQS